MYISINGGHEHRIHNSIPVAWRLVLRDLALDNEFVDLQYTHSIRRKMSTYICGEAG